MRLPSLLCALLLALGTAVPTASGQDVLIPMDQDQTNHLKAYGVVYCALQQRLQQELRVRGVSFQTVNGAAASEIISRVESDGSNMSVVRLDKAPDIAVYAPDRAQPWDDAVRLALKYAEVPHDLIYDRAVLDGKLQQYDWVHLHHEDFTGQFGKFLRFRNTSWFMKQRREAEDLAREYG